MARLSSSMPRACKAIWNPACHMPLPQDQRNAGGEETRISMPDPFRQQRARAALADAEVCIYENDLRRV